MERIHYGSHVLFGFVMTNKGTTKMEKQPVVQPVEILDQDVYDDETSVVSDIKDLQWSGFNVHVELPQLYYSE